MSVRYGTQRFVFGYNTILITFKTHRIITPISKMPKNTLISKRMLSSTRFSEEIFSQHSRRHSNDSASDMSDQEALPVDDAAASEVRNRASIATKANHTPRRRSIATSKAGLLSSPTHRKITPTSIGESGQRGSRHRDDDLDEADPEPSVTEVETFYRDKIAEINRQHDETVRMLKFRLKRFECRIADDEYMVSESRM